MFYGGVDLTPDTFLKSYSFPKSRQFNEKQTYIVRNFGDVALNGLDIPVMNGFLIGIELELGCRGHNVLALGQV